MSGEIPESFDDVSMGEVVSLPPDFIPDAVTEAVEPGLRYTSYGRKVGEVVDIEGEAHRIGLDEMTITAAEEDGHFDVVLHSRRNKIIKATGAALLLATTAGVAIQYNRTHRRKKKIR